MNARELEAQLVGQYGPDFRDLAIASPLGTFRLADSFAEAGLEDPSQSLTNFASQGLWQMMPTQAS